MNTQPKENILNVEQAAEMLDIDVMTVRKLARSGSIPAAKIGREWRFLDVDLIEHIRSKYQLKTDNAEEVCSINAKARRIGGSKSSTTDKQYIEALGLTTKRKHSNTTIN